MLEVKESDKDCDTCKHNSKNFRSEEPCKSCLISYAYKNITSGWEPKCEQNREVEV